MYVFRARSQLCILFSPAFVRMILNFHVQVFFFFTTRADNKYFVFYCFPVTILNIYVQALSFTGLE